MSERLFPLCLTFESYSPSSFNVLFLWIGGREHSLKGCQRQIITLLPLVSHPYTHTDTQRLGQMCTFTVCAPADTPSSGGKVANFKSLDTYNHFSPLLLPFFRPLPFFSCLTCQATEKNSFTLKRGTICRSGEKILFWLKAALVRNSHLTFEATDQLWLGFESLNLEELQIISRNYCYERLHE